MSASVVIANFGTSNIHSILNAFDVVDAVNIKVAESASDILNAERLVLPGQGALQTYMQGLNRQIEMKEALYRVLEEGIPTLGICLGQQCLYEHSEEGNTDGLGLIEGKVKLFSAENKKVPHMGWNNVYQMVDHPLWKGIEDGTRFYFVHSYFVDTVGHKDSVGNTNYVIDFTSVSLVKNVFAVQFHPEKSAMSGLTLLRNFLAWDGISD